jgi:hypothetical protein
MTLNDIAIIFGISASLLTGAGVTGKYYMDHEYVPASSFEKSLLKRDVRDVRKEIRELEWLRDNGGLNDYQQFKLEQLYNDLRELNEDLAN